MTWRKANPEYVEPTNDLPGPRHGHLSNILNPSIAELSIVADRVLYKAWGFGTDSTIEDFRNAIASSPPLLSEHCPKEEQDIEISYEEAFASDGSKIQLKIYKNPGMKRGALLAFKMHGGGWVVGSHETEEEENRRVASIPNVTVVSVNYRL